MKLRGKLIAGFVVVCLFIGGGMTAYAAVSFDWSNNLSAIESNVSEVLGLLNGEKKIVQAKETQIEGLNVQIDNTNNDIKIKDIEINTLKEEIASLEANKVINEKELKHLNLNVRLLNKEKFALLDKEDELE
ncbi:MULTISPECIES: hypothetical protein [unclassified Aerococcus]|uniref:hypothetical protein n=1 Tax=unclassified Aerococcus TaxID=2618060 RepID=UPI0025BFD7BA|nr:MULTISPECIES: hypothetical protein [unclassified Aerococcus]